MSSTLLAPPGDHAATAGGAATSGRRILTLRTAARVVLVASIVVWIASLHRLRDAPLSQYGLLASGGPGLPIATLGVTLAFGLAMRARSVRDAIACIAGFVAVTRATASIIVDLPIFTWTYKHIGVIDHLSSTGSLARNVDIYNNWPGFFSAAAWFSDLTRIPFVDVARWFPVACDAAIVLGMYALARAFGHSTQVALVAAFGIQALNWVGQDYYSPQATAFILALAALALLLRSKDHPRAAWLTVPLFAAITVTHQLTPFWICGIAVLLGLTKRIRPRWIAVVYALIAVAFAVANLKALTPYGLLTGFDPLANAQSNVPTQGNAGREFTSLAARGTSGLMWVTAVVCAIRARRRKEQVWVPAVLAFTSFALLAGQSYGGEAIFRVFLYSMPGCLLLIAPAVHAVITRPAPLRRHTVVRRTGRAGYRLAVVGLTAVLTLGSLQAYYGTWFINVVDRDGYNASRDLLATAPTNSLIIPLVTGIAERPIGRYADLAAVDRTYDALLVEQPGILQSSFSPTEVARLTAGLIQAQKPVYLIISKQMRRYAQYYGLFPPGAVDRLVRELAASNQWTTLVDTPTLSIFQLVRP